MSLDTTPNPNLTPSPSTSPSTSPSPSSSPSSPAISSVVHDPPDTISAAAAYALIKLHPTYGHGGGSTMPPIPDAAMSRRAVHARLSLIATRCELMLVEKVDRMGVRGLVNAADMKLFAAILQFLSRLTAIRKTLDAFLRNAPGAPDDPSVLETELTTAITDFADDDTENDPDPDPDPDSQPTTHNSQPSAPVSQPTTHNSQPASPTIHSVHALPRMPFPAVEPALNEIAEDLAEPLDPPRPPAPYDEDAEREAAARAVRQYKANRPDPRFRPTSFAFRPDEPNSPYRREACPDCAKCQTGSCSSRVFPPSFVTCWQNCPDCEYNFECPWVPMRYKTDPG